MFWAGFKVNEDVCICVHIGLLEYNTILCFRIMAEFEDTESELPWECYTLPIIAKKEKKAKKGKKRKRDKSGIAIKEDSTIQKKKKDSKLREATIGKKAKKRKVKKDKTITLAVEGDFILTQANSASHQEEPWLKVDETLVKKSAGAHHGHEQPFLDESHSILTHRKVRETKKKVGFDLGFASSVTKYPKVAIPSTQLNISCAIQSEGVMSSDVSMAGALRKQCNTQPQDNNESQCTSDDINSQDLFITQKTFRVPPSSQSSGEITEEGLATMPHVHQYVETQAMVIHRHKEPKTQQDHHREAYEELPQFTDKVSTKRQKLRSQLQYEAKTIQPAHTACSHKTQKKLPDVRVSNKANLESLQTHQFSTTDTSTQTENFFTTELCNYLKFDQQIKLDSSRTEVTALDLCLPQRMRAEHENRVSSLDSDKTSALEVKGVVGATGTQTSAGFCSAFRPKKHKGFSVPTQVEVETTPSPQSEAEPKSSETTVSSEDNEASCRSGRVDLMRVIKCLICVINRQV